MRYISDEVQFALGVWVVREGIRKVLESKPIRFSDQKLMFRYVQEKMKRSWGVDGNYFLDKSQLLQGEVQTQLMQF